MPADEGQKSERIRVVSLATEVAPQGRGGAAMSTCADYDAST
jgi:hypothetical protein